MPKIKDSMKACRLDVLQTLSGNYSSNFFSLKIPPMVIIQKRANGYFDMVMLDNRVIGRSMELHAREYRVSHVNLANQTSPTLSNASESKSEKDNAKFDEN